MRPGREPASPHRKFTLAFLQFRQPNSASCSGPESSGSGSADTSRNSRPKCSSTQAVYQFTVVTRTYEGAEEELSGLLPGLAEQLQELLEKTPEGVGWSLSDDLRPVIM